MCIQVASAVRPSRVRFLSSTSWAPTPTFSWPLPAPSCFSRQGEAAEGQLNTAVERFVYVWPTLRTPAAAVSVEDSLFVVGKVVAIQRRAAVQLQSPTPCRSLD